MRKLEALICGSLVAGVACVGMATNANAGTLENTLFPDVINTYEDQSRESLIDIDGSGGISDGDIFIGFLALDDRSIPGLSSVSLPEDGVIGVFSQTVTNFTDNFDDGGDGSVGPAVLNDSYTASWNLVATPDGTGTRLSVSEMYEDATGGGVLPPITGGDTAMFAVLSDIGFDPVNSHPGDIAGVGNVGSVDLLDILHHAVAGGELDMLLGIGTEAGDDDFFSTNVGLFGPGTLINPVVTLSNADSIGLATPVSASFQGGVSVLYEELGAKSVIPEGMPFPNVLPPLSPFSFHDVTVTAGDVGGGADVASSGVGGSTRIINNPLAFTHTVGGTFTAYGFTNNADVSLVPDGAVPEPTTAALGVLALGALAGIRRRKA